MRHRDTIEKLVRTHHAHVYRAAYALLRHDDDARDVAQDVFARLARDPAPLAGAESAAAVLRWLAVRGALDHLRANRNRRARERDHAMEQPRHDARTPDEAAAERGLAEALEAELGKLGDDLRVALELRFRAGLTLKAVGEAVGVSEPSAHARVKKGLETLRGRLERLGFAGLAAAPLERALSAPLEVPVPPGLATSILEHLGLASAASAAAGVGSGAGAGAGAATAAKVGAGARMLVLAPLLALAAALAGVGWHLATSSDVERTGDVAASAPESGRALEITPTASATDGRTAALDAEAGEARPSPSRPEGAVALASRTAEDEETPTGRLVGRAVDADGAPLPDVRVHAYATERAGKPPRFERLTATDAAGRFELALPVAHDDGQLYALALTHRDFVRADREPARVRVGATTDVFDVVLGRNSDDRAGDFALAVLALDEHDVPLAGCAVELVREVDAASSWNRERVEARGTTDDNGRVELTGDRLGPKTLRLDARAATPSAGVHAERIDVLLAGRIERTVHVPAGAAIAGRVLTVDGAVPSGLRLWLAKPLADGGTQWSDVVNAKIEPGGAFRFDGLAPGRYDLWGAGEPWSTLRLESVEAGTDGIALFVKRSDDARAIGDHLAELHGRAVAAETGEPIGIGWLDFEVERLADGLDAAALRSDAIPNALMHSVAQVMLPSGGPPEPTPEFHFDGLSPGTYAITLFAKDRAVGVLAPIELRPHQVVRDLVVEVPIGGAVSGVVRDASGKPLEGAWLVVTGDGPISRARVASIDAEVQADDGRQRYYFGARARTGADGRFTLDHLPPSLPLRLAAVHAKLAPGWSEVIELESGEARGDVVIDLERR